MSFSDYAIPKGTVRRIVKTGLNAGTNDAEHEALIELADLAGLEYDEDKDKYQ